MPNPEQTSGECAQTSEAHAPERPSAKPDPPPNYGVVDREADQFDREAAKLAALEEDELTRALHKIFSDEPYSAAIGIARRGRAYAQDFIAEMYRTSGLRSIEQVVEEECPGDDDDADEDADEAEPDDDTADPAPTAQPNVSNRDVRHWFTSGPDVIMARTLADFLDKKAAFEIATALVEVIDDACFDVVASICNNAMEPLPAHANQTEAEPKAPTDREPTSRDDAPTTLPTPDGGIGTQAEVLRGLTWDVVFAGVQRGWSLGELQDWLQIWAAWCFEKEQDVQTAARTDKTRRDYKVVDLCTILDSYDIERQIAKVNSILGVFDPIGEMNPNEDQLQHDIWAVTNLAASVVSGLQEMANEMRAANDLCGDQRVAKA